MAESFLDAQIVKFPNLADTLNKCKDEFSRKLYHQLTESVETLLNTEESLIRENKQPNGLNFIEFEKEFVRNVRKQLNSESYAQIIIRSSKLNLDSNPKEGIEFCQQACDAMKDVNSRILLRTQIAYFELKQDLKKCKESLEEIETQISKQLKSPPPSVFAHYHYVQALLYQKNGDADKFYRNGMSYLGYSDLNNVNNREKWAEDLAIAAMVEPRFYDFGELSLHPIMKSLEGTERDWVMEILTAFIEASLDTFHDTMKKNQKHIASEPLLKNSESILNEKIRLLALVRLAFDKPSFERVLKFEEIAKVASCNTDEVERLTIRAMSLNLIEGIIDEIDSTISVSNVKPRILDMTEIGNMRTKTQSWVEKIELTQFEIEPLIKDLFK